MKKLKKLLTLLLCAGLLITSIPLQARAETVELPEEGISISHYEVNPLYKGIVEEPAPLLKSNKTDVPVLKAEDYYNSAAAAGDAIRSTIVNRVSQFTVGIKSSSNDFKAVARSILDEAMRHTGVPNEGDYLLWQYASWGYGGNYKTSGGYYYITFDFTLNYFTTAAQEQQVDNKLNQIYNQLNVNNASDYKKVKAIYDWICSNITYDFDNPDDYKLKHSAWAGLMNGTCVCQGYALIFYRMALHYGVDARLIAGDGGGPHGWNIVKMGNLYYNVDSTWDAGQNPYRYFLVGSNNFTDHQAWEDYTTPEFKRNYPISATNYVGCDGTNHSYSKTRVEPTCTQPGSETEYCTACGAKGKTTTIPAMGHNYSGGKCTRCGHVNVPTSGTCGTGVNWVINNGLLNIYGNGSINEYNGSNMPWIDSANNITAIIVGEGVTRIGSYAFYNLTSAKTLSIGSTVASIGDYAFANCSSLQSVVIPSGVSSIGNGAFYMCRSLNHIDLPRNITTLNSYVLGYCNSLTKLEVPAGVTIVKDYAFTGSGIKTFIFRGNAPNFSSNAFNGITASAVYPANMSSWNSIKGYGYGGNITWRMEGEALPAPTLNGTVTVGGVIKLSWNTVIGAAKYNVYRAYGKGNFVYLGAVTGNIYTDTGAAVGAEYRYYVTAIDDSGVASKNSNIVTCTITIPAPVVSVSNVASSGKIKLTWNQVGGADEYKVYRATSKNGKYGLMKTAYGTSYTNTTAKPGTKYYYYVVAVSYSGAKSPKSNIVSRTCDLAKPAITLSNVASTGKVKVTWKKVEGAAKYEVWRATSGGAYKRQTTVTSLNWTDKNSTAGKTYYYKVKAIHSNTGANSVYSEIKSRMADLKAPVVKITTSSGKPKVSWAGITNAKEYKIYRATSKNGTYKAVYTTKNKSWKDTTAKKGKTYYYKVVAVHSKSAANSAYSNIVYKKCTK